MNSDYRKPIQISITYVENVHATQCNYIRTVLCNDGTIWENDDMNHDWREMKPIPQPKEARR